jgi:hypothetical protein
VDADPRNRLGLLQAHMRPRLAGVGGFINAVALNDVAAQLRFSHPGVHDVGVRARNLERADRRCFDLTIGDGPPRKTRVSGLPDSAADGAEVVLVGARRTSRDRLRSAAARGTDRAPSQTGEEGRVDLREWRSVNEAEQQDCNECRAKTQTFHGAHPNVRSVRLTKGRKCRYSRGGAPVFCGTRCALQVVQEGTEMLFTIAVILLVLWLLGLVSGYTLGNFIYVLLVIAVVLFIVGLVSGRRTV